MNNDDITVYVSESLIDKVDMSEFYSMKSENSIFCSIFFKDNIFHCDLEKMTTNSKITILEFMAETDFVVSAVGDEDVEKVVILYKEESLKEIESIKDTEIEIKFGQNSHYITMTILS